MLQYRHSHFQTSGVGVLRCRSVSESANGVDAVMKHLLEREFPLRDSVPDAQGMSVVIVYARGVVQRRLKKTRSTLDSAIDATENAIMKQSAENAASSRVN